MNALFWLTVIGAGVGMLFIIGLIYVVVLFCRACFLVEARDWNEEE